eukprot:scaffold132995_cov48-Phaeocystis_antarctica.AAC.2
MAAAGRRRRWRRRRRWTHPRSSCVRCLPRKSQWGKLTSTLIQGETPDSTDKEREYPPVGPEFGPGTQHQLSHSKADRQAVQSRQRTGQSGKQERSASARTAKDGQADEQTDRVVAVTSVLARLSEGASAAQSALKYFRLGQTQCWCPRGTLDVQFLCGQGAGCGVEAADQLELREDA